MAEKNDDIKQLFTHLGLNPSDYQEIRSAARTPERHNESAETPRRWSLIDAVPVETPADRQPSAPPVVEVLIDRPLPSEPPAVTAPPARELSRAELERESLQSFFEAVKEPLPPTGFDSPQDGPSIPVTTELRLEARVDETLRDSRDTAEARIADLVRSRWPASEAPPAARTAAADPVTVRETTRRIEPAPPPAAFASPAEPGPAGDARLRLRFGETAKTASEAAQPESLATVFRRLAAAGSLR